MYAVTKPGTTLTGGSYVQGLHLVQKFIHDSVEVQLGQRVHPSWDALPSDQENLHLQQSNTHVMRCGTRPLWNLHNAEDGIFCLEKPQPRYMAHWRHRQSSKTYLQEQWWKLHYTHTSVAKGKTSIT